MQLIWESFSKYAEIRTLRWEGDMGLCILWTLKVIT